MSAHNVTPIRPGAEPPSGDQPVDVIDAHLAQAKAICDLIFQTDRESLYDDTIGWALYSAIDHIEAAREAAGKLNQARAGDGTTSNG